MRPMLKYPGGKSKEIQEFIKYIPYFDGKYIEPFFGGGSLFFYLEPQQSIINDINTKLIGFYKGVRDDFSQLKKELTELERTYKSNRDEYDFLKNENPYIKIEDKNEKLYYELRDMYNSLIPSKYLDSTLYYFINKTAYSGMIRYNSKGEYNVPYGRYKNFNTEFITPGHHELLKNTEIYNGDYSKIFDMSKPDDFIFLDPPYDCVFSNYENEEFKDGFGEDNQRKLAEDFKNLGCKSMMVISETPLIRELYKDYIFTKYDKSYSVNIKNRFDTDVKHLIITNYKK